MKVMAIMPFVGKAGLADARLAVEDVAKQQLPSDVQLEALLIDQGRACFDELQDMRPLYPEGWLHTWHPYPALVSLSATWNTALAWAWAEGNDAAWVLNNDVRLRPDTLAWLLEAMERYDGAGFVSAYGVSSVEEMEAAVPTADVRGGPDFSCFLIRKRLHKQETFLFDESFAPAYCEDLDFHRRMLLAGRGDEIFSTGVCYYHKGSGTLRAMEEKQRHAFGAEIERNARSYYRKKWGGSVNEERFLKPFGPAPQGEVGYGITTAQLFQAVRERW